MTRQLAKLLMAATAIAAASPAMAQGATEISAEIAALRARIDALQARLDAQEEAPAAPPAMAPAEGGTEVRFSGAPRITAPGGWSFKPRGRLQFDAAHVSRPAGITDPGLGFSNEVRRARLGVEGSMPGGFGYVFELDFSDNGVEIVDALLSYRASDNLSLTLGQHNNFQGLEELTSSRFTSFIERAAFTDAFNFERRVGLSAAYSRGPLLIQGGIFTDNIGDLTEDANNSLGVDGRVVIAPKLGETQLHFGASAHYRDTGDLVTAAAPTRYRQRPLVHSTDVRFITTPSLLVSSETSYGVEAAVIRGPFHAAGEAHWLRANLATPGDSPTFFGGYAEIGWFLTGESRGYRGGRFDRTRVRRSVEEGGWGALQLNLRYDHLDLTDAGIFGGTQNGVMASLIWIPTDYIRFMLNYARLDYDGAALPAASGNRDYGVNVVGARAQIDF